MVVVDHVVVAVLPLVGYTLLRYRRLPSGSLVLVAFAGGLLPDIVDKPLAWTLGVIPSGRMVAHSVVLAVPLVVCLLAVAFRADRLTPGVVFGYAYLSHLVGDFAPVFALGSDYYYYPNMFWPLATANPDPDPSFGGHVPGVSTEVVVELLLIAVVVAYIAFDLRRRWRSRPVGRER